MTVDVVAWRSNLLLKVWNSLGPFKVYGRDSSARSDIFNVRAAAPDSHSKSSLDIPSNKFSSDLTCPSSTLFAVISRDSSSLVGNDSGLAVCCMHASTNDQNGILNVIGWSTYFYINMRSTKNITSIRVSSVWEMCQKRKLYRKTGNCKITFFDTGYV